MSELEGSPSQLSLEMAADLADTLIIEDTQLRHTQIPDVYKLK